ncbi:hypothetical protein EIP91_012161 [Steccherinum ochraceum]|uniref:Uncharacterized protein n=1 Tax=Steccherinum ochraceum TaxID=92696 RepID=A0A4R0RH66_9APHY|nr:hypothetical protein EIP91_012161 [Steccherinum ochraceum]
MADSGPSTIRGANRRGGGDFSHVVGQDGGIVTNGGPVQNGSTHDDTHSLASTYHTAGASEELDDPNGADAGPPPPSYETALDNFADMNINDPLPRGTSGMSNRVVDPMYRTGTPVSPSMTSPQRTHGQQPLNFHPDVQQRPPPDGMSVRSGGSGNSDGQSLYNDGRSSWGYDTAETDRTSAYSYDEQQSSLGHGGYDPRNGAYAQAQGGYQPPFDPRYGYNPAPRQPPPQMNFHNPLYAAASDVLGMGPPPGAMAPPPMGPPPGAMQPHPPRPPQQAAYGPGPGPAPSQFYPQGPPHPSSSAASIVSVGSNSYLAAGPGPGAYPPDRSPSPLARGPSSGPPSSSASSYLSTEDPEILPRPSLQRSGTTASVSLRTHKSKAIDLSAPPYTKEYIDQYRVRIKDDPDPEAHFLYAKYLIDAARHIAAEAKDSKSWKRFRDSLIQESLKVVRKLATQGQAYDEAQFFLANCHGTGMLGLPVDHERAYHLYLQAAKQNHAAASYRVAVCNEIGAGTRREPQRAAAFYRKAASLGDTAAMYKLGVVLLRGTLGEQPNPREAVGWLRRAAEQADEENPHALYELALLHEATTSQVVPYDPVYAKDLYTRAGHLGYTHAQYKLGQCYEYGALSCPVDPRRSIAWYTKAAEKGHSEAELALSGWYLTGSEGILKQSDSEAYLWARKAANKGLSKAEYAVGYYAEVGIGVKQDIEFAKRWYMRAAAQGNKRAMNRLTEMKRTGNKRMNTARPTRQDAKEECVIA